MSKEEKNKKSRDQYLNRLVDKLCIECGLPMKSRRNVVLCNVCKSKNNYRTNGFGVRDLCCNRCLSKIGEEKYLITHGTKNKRITKKLCLKCSNDGKFIQASKNFITSPYLTDESRKQIASLIKQLEVKISNKDFDSQQIIENIKNKINVEKTKIEPIRKIARKLQLKKIYVPVSDEIKKQQKEKCSVRMKKDNPMKKQSVVLKMSQSLKSSILSGKTKYKKGAKHHLWKGNRGFNLDCRNRLYQVWIKPVMTRDNFTCIKCSKKGQLQVHHVRPLRDIIEKVLTNNNILDITNVDTKTDLYEFLIQEVLNEHKLKDGITVCAKCHDKIDDRYRRHRNAN